MSRTAGTSPLSGMGWARLGSGRGQNQHGKTIHTSVSSHAQGFYLVTDEPHSWEHMDERNVLHIPDSRVQLRVPVRVTNNVDIFGSLVHWAHGQQDCSDRFRPCMPGTVQYRNPLMCSKCRRPAHVFLMSFPSTIPSV